MNQEEAKLASKKLNQLLEKWEEDEISDIEFCEYSIPHIRTINAYFEKIQSEDDEPRADPDPNLAEDLETPGAKEDEELQEDLFSKEETADLEEEKEDVDDESKSSKKKRKSYAGSDGEIPF